MKEERKEKNNSVGSEDIRNLQMQLKKQQLEYQMEKLKKSWNWPYGFSIAVLFIFLILFLLCSQYFLPTFAIFSTEYLQVTVNKIWANVFILFLKTMILAIVLFFMYQITKQWLESRD